MKQLLFLLLPVFVTGCFTTYPTSTPFPKEYYINKYSNRLDAGSQMIAAGYHYSTELTPAGTYLHKVYFPETGQMTQSFTYADKKLKIKSGKSVEWYDNGNKYCEGEYKNNEKEGLWQFFDFDNGSLVRYGNYLNGKEDGLWKTVDSLGHTTSEHTYKDGKLHGPFQVFDKHGSLIEKGSYELGQLAYAEHYKDGKKMDGARSYELPRFPGCESLATLEERKACSDRRMLEYVYRNIRYPSDAREDGVDGTAITKFVIDKDGHIQDIVVMRGLCTAIKKECERVVKTMPPWIPGKQDGEVVRVQFLLPLRFVLE